MIREFVDFIYSNLLSSVRGRGAVVVLLDFYRTILD